MDGAYGGWADYFDTGTDEYKKKCALEIVEAAKNALNELIEE